MSWDDPRTDMAHCTWCSWDIMKADGPMHTECAIKSKRRDALRNRIRPQLIAVGLPKPDFHNLLTDICRRIEKAMDEEQTEVGRSWLYDLI